MGSLATSFVQWTSVSSRYVCTILFEARMTQMEAITGPAISVRAPTQLSNVRSIVEHMWTTHSTLLSRMSLHTTTCHQHTLSTVNHDSRNSQPPTTSNRSSHHSSSCVSIKSTLSSGISNIDSPEPSPGCGTPGCPAVCGLPFYLNACSSADPARFHTLHTTPGSLFVTEATWPVLLNRSWIGQCRAYKLIINHLPMLRGGREGA